MAAFKVGDVVVIRVDLPEEGLRKGQIGTVVLEFTEPTVAFETEFADDEGRTIAQLALVPEQIAHWEGNADQVTM